MCEPLTGSGIRTLRYLNECSGDFNAKMFDANPNAVDTAQRNIKRLGFEDRARVLKGDAKYLLLSESREKRFDYVDVDPFGTPAPYLNAAIQSLNPEGGFLALTATDMPVLCGAYPNVAMRRYGGFSTRAPFTHEIAIRLLQALVFRVAGLNDYSIKPYAILSTDHYVRTWVKVNPDRKTSNKQVEFLGTIRYCPSCMQSKMTPLSKRDDESTFEHAKSGCKGPVKRAGPLWIGNLFQGKVIENAIDVLNKDDVSLYHRRVPRILNEMNEEQSLMEFPFIDLHAVCDLYSLRPPRNEQVIEYLKDRGHKVARTHFRPTAIRTDASVQEVASAISNILKG